MARRLRVSLANKCQVLFGLATLLIILASLAVVWQRFDALIAERSFERGRDLGRWALLNWKPGSGEREPFPGVLRLSMEQAERQREDNAWLDEALNHFEAEPDERHHTQRVTTPSGEYRFRYARVVRESDLVSDVVAQEIARTPRELRPPDPMRGWQGRSRRSRGLPRPCLPHPCLPRPGHHP